MQMGGHTGRGGGGIMPYKATDLVSFMLFASLHTVCTRLNLLPVFVCLFCFTGTSAGPVSAVIDLFMFTVMVGDICKHFHHVRFH